MSGWRVQRIRVWQHLPLFEGGFTCDWAVFEGRLYAADDEGVGRWNETTQM